MLRNVLLADNEEFVRKNKILLNEMRARFKSDRR